MIIKVTDNIKRFINKCMKHNINLYDINYIDDYLLVRIDENDYDNIKKLNYYSKIVIIKYLGKRKILLFLKRNIYNLILLLIFLLLLYFYSNVVISIDIKHENKTLIKKVDKLLNDAGIKKYRLIKTNKELNEISDNILVNNRDFLDFISITRKGMKYIVNIEERILKETEEEKENCHVIAVKDGVVLKIDAKKGIINTEVNNLVHAGDILISGKIMLNEETKESICAEGDVYANTWYKINITYPLIKNEKKYTNREKINIKIYDNYLKKRFYKNYDEKTLLKIKNIKIVKQREYKIIKTLYSYEDSKELALNYAIEKLKEKHKENFQIIDKKVLKEYKNNSTIELEIFVSVNEIISKQIEYKGDEENDTSESIQYNN